MRKSRINTEIKLNNISYCSNERIKSALVHFTVYSYSYFFSIDHSAKLMVLSTWLVSTGVGVNAAWLKVTVGPSRSLAAVWS